MCISICIWSHIHIQFSSVTQSSLTLCDLMNRSTPGLPVQHQLLESTQTHVHWVGDAILPSHPLSSPSPPAFNFPSIRVFSNEPVLRITWPKYWSFSFGIRSFRMDWLDLLAVQGLSRVFSNTTIQKHQFFSSQLSLWSRNHLGNFANTHVSDLPPLVRISFVWGVL